MRGGRHAPFCASCKGVMELDARARCAHVVSGKLNKQIASDLGAAERTIKAHRASIMEKLGVQSVAELVRLAQELGIEPIR